LSSELITAKLSDDVTEAETMIEGAARDIARAVKQSFQGSRLIKYVDLPPQWRCKDETVGRTKMKLKVFHFERIAAVMFCQSTAKVGD
jgi:hypothetical protein